MQVTEHQIESKVCLCCQNRNWPQLSAGIKGNADVEYGPKIKGLAMDLIHHHFVPPRRARTIRCFSSACAIPNL